MTVATAKQKKKKTHRIGRKPLSIPRERRYVYMTAQTHAAVQEWQQAERRNGRAASFNDALEEMVEMASYYAADTNAALRHQPLDRILNGLSTCGPIPKHIRVEPNGGRSLRCSHCDVWHKVSSRRFSGLLREIAAFVDQHVHEPEFS